MYPVNKSKFNIFEWMDSDYNMDERICLQFSFGKQKVSLSPIKSEALPVKTKINKVFK